MSNRHVGSQVVVDPFAYLFLPRLRISLCSSKGTDCPRRPWRRLVFLTSYASVDGKYVVVRPARSSQRWNWRGLIRWMSSPRKSVYRCVCCLELTHPKRRFVSAIDSRRHPIANSRGIFVVRRRFRALSVGLQGEPKNPISGKVDKCLNSPRRVSDRSRPFHSSVLTTYCGPRACFIL